MTRLAQWTAFAALGLLLLLPAHAGAAVHARVLPSLRTGAGWGSDLFLGADLGASVEARVAPSLRLDLSLSPSLKLWTAFDFAFGLYEVTRSTSVDHNGEVGARFRLTPRLTAELAASYATQSLSVAQSVDEATGVEASESAGFDLAPGLRYLHDGLLLEALYDLGTRHHVLAEGDELDDLTHLAILGAGFALGPLWAGLSLRGQREDSSDPAFSYWGASLHGSLAARPLSPLTIRLSASAHRNRFDTGRDDTLLKAAIAPTLRLGALFAIESSYGYAWNFSDSDGFDASRHFVYLGLRVEGELWRR